MDTYTKKTDNPDYFKNYYNENKEKIKSRVYSQVQCECGATILRCNLSNHMKTKKHIVAVKYIKSLLDKQTIKPQ